MRSLLRKFIRIGTNEYKLQCSYKMEFLPLNTVFSFESSAQISMCHWDIVKAALCSCWFAISSLSSPISSHQMNDWPDEEFRKFKRASHHIFHLCKTIWNWRSSGTECNFSSVYSNFSHEIFQTECEISMRRRRRRSGFL